MEGLEFVFRLKWRNRSDNGTSVVRIYDTPSTTHSLELFKSNLFRNARGVDLDAAGLRVAMQVSRNNELVIDSQLEFERVLLAFRHKATKKEVIVINVYEGNNDSGRSETANGTETMNEEVEDPKVSKTGHHIPHKERKPVQSILELPPEVLLNIFAKLDHTSISKCARACKKFHELSKDWKLFPDIDIIYRTPEKYVKWLLDRATNPRKVRISRQSFSDFLTKKLVTWHNLQELALSGLDLSVVGEGSLKKLRVLLLSFCTINCQTFGNLLKHSKTICKVSFLLITCSHCNTACNTGILPLLHVDCCVKTLEEIFLWGKHIVQQDFQQLSVCVNLKTLHLFAHSSTPSREEAVLAMGMVGRKCLKLESVTLRNLDLIQDSVLEVLFSNCSNLKELRLEVLRNITETSCLMAINVLPHLQHVAIQHCYLVTRSSEVKLRDAIAGLERLSGTRTPPELEFFSLI